MLQKLAEVEERFEELNRRLSDPSVVQNRSRFTELSREHRQLQELVELVRQLRRVSAEVEGNKALLASESDAEILAMAKDELVGLEIAQRALEDKVRLALLPRDPNDDK